MAIRIEDFVKAAERRSAEGIPDRDDVKPLPKITASKTWEFGVHEHNAERRGLHYDLRLGDPSTGHAHSWATRQPLPKPGESIWAIQQPTHTVRYMDFEGTLPTGYGAGTVKLFDRGKTEILRASPGHIVFNVYRGRGPEEYVLHQISGTKWKFINRTVTREQLPQAPTDKPKYKNIALDKIDFTNDSELMSAKIDDAHNLFVFEHGKPVRVVSYRPSSLNESGIIEHTHKVKTLHDVTTPAEIGNAVIRGGLYAIDPKTKRAVDASTLAGMLNSNVWKSREDQKVHGELQPVIYDVVSYKGRDMSNAPYREKLDVLHAIRKALPQFELPTMATTAQEKRKLLSEIVDGRHAATTEGVVMWPLHKGDVPAKAKVTEEHDVYVRGTFPAEPGSKYEGNAVGGFVYSHTPHGEIVGRVGTGLSDAQRRDMHKNPETYIGMVGRVAAMAKYPSGALRAPAFLGFHLDKNDQAKLDRVKLADMATTPQPYQQRVVDRIQQPDQPGLVVVHGLGSGKTRTAIHAADALHKPTTAVVPASLKPNFQKEVHKHLVPGTGPDINVQSLQRLAVRHEPVHTGTLIVDEAHRLRDANSATAEAVRQSEAEKRLLLTATPFYNHPADIATPINIAAGRTVLPEDQKAFENRYIVKDKVQPGLMGRILGVEPGEVSRLNPAKQQELRQIFQKWVDYHATDPNDPNFPRTNEQTIQVPMTSQQRQVYDVLMNKAPLWLRLKIRMGLPPTVGEARQLNAFLNGARQVSNTTRVISPGMPVQEPKIQRAAQDLQDYLAANERAKAVVYSNYLESGLHPYAEYLKKQNVPHALFTGELDEATKAEMVRAYNEGKIRALLVSSAGGEGLDLKGTRMVQLLEPHWNEEKLNQIIGRGVRFKSHEMLSPEEREVQIRHYLSTYPQEFSLLQRIGLKKQDKAVDEYLSMLANQKQQLVGQFQGLFPRG